MPVMDEFREEREAIKSSSMKKKWGYFLDYYKWYVIGGAAIILFLVFLIRDMMNSKDWAFYGAFINTYTYEDNAQTLMDDFAKLAELDTEKYAVDIDDSLVISTTSYDETTMTSVQKLMVYMAAGDVDFVAADATTFEQYASDETFFDLTTILSEEQIEKYQDYFYYVDMAEVRKKDEASENGDLDYVGKEYDHRKPEEMENPVAVALYINDCEKIKEAYLFREEEVPMGVVLNTTHLDTTLKFIDYIFE